MFPILPPTPGEAIDLVQRGAWSSYPPVHTIEIGELPGDRRELLFGAAGPAAFAAVASRLAGGGR